jgi:hypothetical protein
MGTLFSILHISIPTDLPALLKAGSMISGGEGTQEGSLGIFVAGIEINTTTTV